MAEASKGLVTGGHRLRLWGSGLQGRRVLVPKPARQGGDRMVKYYTGCSSYVSKVMD